MSASRQMHRHRTTSRSPSRKLLHAPLPILQYMLLVLSTIAISIPLADGFAEWTKCWVELEEDEIIMNHPVVHSSSNMKSDEQPQQIIRLVAMNHDGETVSSTSGKRHHDIKYAPGDTFRIRIYPSTPKEGRGTRDGIDVPPNIQWLVESSEGGTFNNDRTSMCDGRRAVGRNLDSTVKLTLTGEEDVVRVWAGHASNKEAVTLTPTLTFRKVDDGRQKPMLAPSFEPPDL